MKSQILGIIAAFTFIASGVAQAQLAGNDSLLCGGVVQNMQNLGVIPVATGEAVYVVMGKKGAITEERMVIIVRGATPNNPYHVFAQLSGGGDPVNAVDFTTDSSGNTTLVYHPVGKPPVTSVPAQFNPATRIHQLTVVDLTTNVLIQTNVILRANFDTSTDFNLATKRKVNTNGVVLNLIAKANVLKALLKLTASGLAPHTDYLVVLDGQPQTSVTSGGTGKLKFSSTPPPLKVWSADSIALWDSSSNVVAQITLR
jgi:hypothetical protein